MQAFGFTPNAGIIAALNPPTSFRTMPRVLIAALLLSVLPHASASAGGDAQAGKVKAYTCTGCHGIPGYKNTYPQYDVPKLGGQNAAYIKAALEAYQSGQRRHATMNSHAEGLSAEDIADIAAWLASLPAGEAGPARRNAEAGRDKSTPCQACHGDTGIAVDAMYPSLAGQHASYLAKALKDYRDGERVNPLMSGFAANLTDQDIADLSAWFASQAGLRDLSAD